MIRGITFSEQVFYSKDFAHFQNVFLDGACGTTKGCEITQDGTKVTIGTGYFFAHGRLMNIEEPEIVQSSQGFQSGYNRIVYEIDLSKENTITEFRQGYIKILNTEDLTQEDLDAGGSVYQFPFCHFQWSGSVITGLVVDAPTLSVDDIMGQWSDNFTSINAEFEAYFTQQKEETESWVQSQQVTVEEMIAELQAKGFEKAATYVSTTMQVSGWTDNVYEFPMYPFESYNIEIQPSDLCTAEQIEAWGAALIVGSNTSNNCKALGDVPTIDIPIIIKVVRKAGVTSVTLLTSDYTGKTEASTTINGEEVDIDNMSSKPDAAADGDVIITEEGE